MVCEVNPLAKIRLTVDPSHGVATDNSGDPSKHRPCEAAKKCRSSRTRRRWSSLRCTSRRCTSRRCTSGLWAAGSEWLAFRIYNKCQSITRKKRSREQIRKNCRPDYILAENERFTLLFSTSYYHRVQIMLGKSVLFDEVTRH